MNKAEFITCVAQGTGLTKTATNKALETLLTTINKTLKKEGRFVLHGLGSFEVVKRKKRTARNPRTNEPVIVKAHKAVKFKTSKALKDAVK